MLNHQIPRHFLDFDLIFEKGVADSFITFDRICISLTHLKNYILVEIPEIFANVQFFKNPCINNKFY